MNLDLSRIEKLQERGETYQGRCPACAEEGQDKKGNHLTIWPSGQFACAAHQGDSEHRRAIFRLVGKAKPTEPRRASASPLHTFTLKPSPATKCATPEQLQLAHDAAKLLACTPIYQHNAGAALGIPPETVRACAEEGSLGIIAQAVTSKGQQLAPYRLAYIYPHGLKVRHPWGADHKCRFLWLYGRAAEPWRFHLMPQGTAKVYLTEGESDALALLSLMLEGHVLASPGTSFQPHWAPLFQGKDITLCFDLDPPGQDAAHKVTELLKPYARSIHTLKPSPSMNPTSSEPKPKDLRELLSECGPDKLHTMVTDPRNLTKAHDAEQDGQRLTVKAFSTPTNDHGNALLFVSRWKHELRYIAQLKQWLLLRQGIWHRVSEAEAIQRARQLCQELKSLAGQVENDASARAAFARAQSMGRLFSIQATVRLASCDPAIRIEAEKADENPMLMGVKNGVLDLEAGHLITHGCTDYVTRVAGTHFDPAAQCPTWKRFLADTFDGSPELISYMQKAMGYSLTGRNELQVFWFLYGGGKNGKSKFTETLYALMGSYAIRADDSLLVDSPNLRPGPSMARLPGIRLLMGAETSEGQRMNEKTVKEITGGDTMTAEAKYCAPFDFLPKCKFWMYGNHKPTVRGTDNGIWRRVRLVHFLNQVSEEKRDAALGDKLLAELPGILNWALEGLSALRKDNYRLTTPECVSQASEEYRNDSDTLGEFIQECVSAAPGKTVSKREVYQRYAEWMRPSTRAMSRHTLALRLKDRGWAESSANYWKDIALEIVPPDDI